MSLTTEPLVHVAVPRDVGVQVDVLAGRHGDPRKNVDQAPILAAGDRVRDQRRHRNEYQVVAEGAGQLLGARVQQP
jgi:hypothetical protein